MAASRLLSIVGAGYCGSLLYHSQDVAAAAAGATLRFGNELSRALITNVKPASGDDHTLRALAAEVALLSRMLGTPKASGTDTRLLLLACAACGLACTTRFDGLAWVTRANFRKGVAALGSGLTAVSSAVARLRASVNERFDLLTGRMDLLGADAAAAAAGVATLSDQLSSVEAKLDAVAERQEFACHGIQALCSVVDGLGQQRGAKLTLESVPMKGTLAEQLAAISALTQQNMRL